MSKDVLDVNKELAVEEDKDNDKDKDKEFEWVENKEDKIEYDDYKKHKSKLENEYLEIFKKVELYVNNSTKLDMFEKNNLFLQVLDSFLCAQKEDKEIGHVIGKDLKKYCDNMIDGEEVSVFKGIKILDSIMGIIFYIVYMQCISRVVVSTLGEQSTIFEPIIFGLGEIILGVSYIFIPILKSQTTKKYFENPKKCKRINIIVYNLTSIVAIIIYTYMEQHFGTYGVNISLVAVAVTLIYLCILRSTIALELRRRDNLEFKEKYNEKLNKEYSKHKTKCENKNKQYSTWNEFLIKKSKSEKVFKIVFGLYGVIFLVFILFIGVGMIIKNELYIVGIVAIVAMWFIEIVLMNVVKKESCLGMSISE